jgi:hypothetical protein
MPSRPLLTAHWSDLLLLNFAVPTDAVAPLAPPGTGPDLHEGQSYISIVGFRFHTCRLLGIPIPGHTSFPEINLRFYVRRTVNNELRRGVVFIREIVPRRLVALVANRLYNENYITRPMRATLQKAGSTLAPNDTLEYAWRTNSPFPDQKEGESLLGSARPRILRLLRPEPVGGRRREPIWNRLAARVAAPLALPAPNSLDEFFVEHYWGYVTARDGATREYRVAHEPWHVAPADNVIWKCDASVTPPHSRRGAGREALFGLAKHLQAPPTTALIAAGSPIQLYAGHRL